MQRSFFVVLGLIAALVVLSARPSAAQETLDAARDLYASAAYEDALAVLDRLSTTTGSPSDRFVINQYRAFCYLALGRAHDAQRAIETLVSDRPLYQPSDAEASPRLRSAFSVVRQRMLPAIVQQKYAQAKTAFDYKDYVAAEAGFTEVINALGDPDMGTAASLPPLSDMGTLASGFKELSSREIARAAAEAAATIAAAEAASAAEAARAQAVSEQAAAALASSHRVFTMADSKVSPPVIIRQDLPYYPRSFGLMREGALDILIDESGVVEEAVMRTSANPRYDTLALAATRNWKFKPATLDGAPVKFRKTITVALKQGGE
jgi:TonB family protein